MKGKPWTVYDREFLRLVYAELPTRRVAQHLGRSERAVYSAAYLAGLKKSARFLASPAAGRTNGRQGIGSRFRRGHHTWNKGRKGWTAGGRSALTRFRPGHRPQNWVPIGTETVTKDGYLKRKVRDDAPKGMTRHNWRFVHELLWESQHGPVPAGRILVFRNRDPADIRIDNLELISRRENMLRNSRHRLPAALNQVIAIKARLTRVINERSR